VSIKLRLKHSATANKAPLPGDLVEGELALNINAASPAAYIKDSTGAVVKLAGAGAVTATASETVSGVVELATAAETTGGTDNTRAVHPAGLKVELDKKAPLASPALTGAPTAPTAAAGTNTTQLATTAFVHAATPNASATVPGLAQLADATAITAGTAGRVVDAAQLKAVSDADDWSRTGTTLSPKTAGDVVNISAGTAALPGLAVVGDAGTGLSSPGPGQLAISSNGTGRLFVDANGRLGVGVASPGFALDVAGTIRSSSTLKVDSTTQFRLLEFLNSGTRLGFVVFDSVNNALGFNAESAGAYQVFNTGGSERLRITSAGLVGIGTTSPGFPLDVVGTIGTTPALANSGSLLLSGNSGAAAGCTIESSFTSGGYGPLLFKVNNGEAARIDSSGRRLLVGTSTTSSVTTLLLQGNSSGGSEAAILRLARGASAPADGTSLGAISFQDSGHVGAAAVLAARDGGTWTSGSSQPTRLVFSTTADGAGSPTERMRIKSTGTINFSTVATYADNTAAKAGGLVAGDIYRKADGTLMIAF
jgi:hypothetical protein